MRIFMSYSSRNRAEVLQLVNDLEDIGHRVWIDQALTGGQEWWDEILANIRNCEVFIFALTPEYVKSVPCQRELTYAQAVRRPLVPVLLHNVAVHLLPASVQSLQLIDYRKFDKDDLKRLIRAFNTLPLAPDLPHPLPPLPEAPISQLAGIARDLQSDALSYETQTTLYERLVGVLGTSEGDDARALLVQLRQHPQVTVQIAEATDRVLTEDAFVSASATFSPVTICKDDGHYHFAFEGLRVMHKRENLIQLARKFFAESHYVSLESDNPDELIFQRGSRLKRYTTLGNPRESGHIRVTVTFEGEAPTQIHANLALEKNWQQIWLEADFRYFQSELEELRQTLFQGEYTRRYSESMRLLARYESYWESAKLMVVMTFGLIVLLMLLLFIGASLSQWLVQDLTIGSIADNILRIAIIFVVLFFFLPLFTYIYLQRIQKRTEARVLMESSS